MRSEPAPKRAAVRADRTIVRREAAAREILDLISNSRDDEKPVFDAILQWATELCSADSATIVMGRAGDRLLNLVAHRDVSPATVALYDRGQVLMDPGVSSLARAILSGETVHVVDTRETEGYRSGLLIDRSVVDDSGIRTEIYVPLMQAGVGIGAIIAFRKEVRPFSADEIVLAETFAAQAVIAIENVRQFRDLRSANAELRNRLEREAATRAILEVISQSRSDELPVFRAILANAQRLCGAPYGNLNMITDDGERLEIVADGAEVVDPFRAGWSWPIESRLMVTRSARECQILHVDDAADDELSALGDNDRLKVVASGARSVLTVPLISDGRGIGSVGLYRREVKPFTPDEIALVETFAAQAVIAIENVRQFRELQNRLEREAATRDILEVISQSRDDDRPVFNAVLRSALRLCGAHAAALVMGQEGDMHQRMVAADGVDPATIALYESGKVPMNPEISFAAKAILTRKVVHIDDMMATEGFRRGDGLVFSTGRDAGIRTIMYVPLVTATGGIGALNIFRREVRPYTTDEIALVESFAAQAVIAIENVRQFRALEALNSELSDRVEEQVSEIERMGRLKRFLPAAVADTVISSGSEKMLTSHRALLGVLFCDIRGFTAFCETAEPEETIEVLQTYHEEMGKLIEAHGAGVDHRMGDGIMVLFNDPLPCEDPAGAAVGLALAMRARMAELAARWKRMGHRLGFGVGIALGYATVGMVGSGGRFEYTASGTVVNLAARLCDEAADGEILVSPRAAAAVDGTVPLVSIAERSLKGIREPVEVFRVTVPS